MLDSCGQADEIVSALVSAEIRALLDNEAWKERLNGATSLLQFVQAQESFGWQLCGLSLCLTLAEGPQAQAIVTYLETKSKGWKETNFQVWHAI